MDHDYITEEQRIRQHLKETLTGRQKLAHWWEYHKVHTAITVILLLFLLYFALQDRSIPDPDYTVAWVSGHVLEDGVEESISQMLSQYGQDLNHDGIVSVSIHQIRLDLGLLIERGCTAGQQEYGELLVLNSDLEVGQSGIFLTDDAASLQAYTGALLYCDGTLPEQDAKDWENMVIAWEQDGIGIIYAGLRGCWKDSWTDTWAEYQVLWKNLLIDKNPKIA